MFFFFLRVGKTRRIEIEIVFDEGHEALVSVSIAQFVCWNSCKYDPSKIFCWELRWSREWSLRETLFECEEAI